MLVLDRSACGDTRAALATEWIAPNGAGGYAALTVAGACTRREHGLLVVALDPPGRQTVLLSGLEERLILEGREYTLTTVAADEVESSGATQHLISLGRAGRLVRSEHLVEGLRLERRIAVPAHKDAVIVSYRVLEVPPNLHRRPILLEVSPLFAYHSVDGGENNTEDELDLTAYLIEDKVRFEPRPPLPPLFFTHESDVFQPAPGIIESLPLPEGAPSGAVPEITLGRAGCFIYQLGPERPAYLAASAREPLEGPPQRMERLIKACETPIRRRPGAKARGRLTTALLEAAETYVLSSGRVRRWISSSYPGGEYGWHEAMIALPGLTLSTGLHDVAREILIAAARTMTRGRLPAAQMAAAAPGDTGSVFLRARISPTELASLRATLRFFDTAELYLRTTGDVRTTRKLLYPALRDCLAHLLAGATGARVTEDGLLETEAPPPLLGQRSQTPPEGDSAAHALRAGLNALWCGALASIRDLAREFNDQAVAEEAETRWDQASRAYGARFWNAGLGCLYDAVVGGTPDPTRKPIQILAVGQRHPLLDREQASSVVAVVERELLTPRGLRSLAPGEPGYAGLEYLLHIHYPNLGLRGSAYPWLLGPFATAYLNVHSFSSSAKDRLAFLLTGFIDHLREGAIGQISERFDGDAPHSPRGRPASAASVAELLRVCLDYLGGEV